MKKKYKLYRNYGIILVLVIGVILLGRHLSLISVSPYCMSLPPNAFNTVSLGNDKAGCPHWYIEIRSIQTNCFCISGNKICEGDPDYIQTLEGCSGALPPGCPTCPIYKYTPIADYGGLLEGFDCGEDLMQTCSDNSKIVIKQCIEGHYVNTNNKCNVTPTPNTFYIIISIIILIVIILVARRTKIK